MSSDAAEGGMHMAVGKVQVDGQIALPTEVRRAVGIKPGDLLSVDVTESGTVEIRRLSTLRLSEALERYRIEGPIDDAADREKWQDIAARDVFGSDERE
jgi:AbrB family looped-hinge helix DNA binding protein